MYGKSDPRYPILGYCLCSQSFSGVLQRFGSGVQPAVVNLMKKGFLRFADTRPPLPVKPPAESNTLVCWR